MQLIHYIQGLGDEDKRVAFAERAGTSPAYLLQLAYGYKRASVNMCVSIEKASRGAVRCEELRKDVDWAYLKGRK
ncbi:MAG TPA: YdaS family helix-turn-helix protein [Candidatus Krumholzibacteria bacterium]|nr:YdaS family helix-turn-helix protein [Candidatus Krumholzibacteria bacterium]HPD73445.1 YdaS family helix-turn-helix protein [Candidatus Krumholzibacteria bacterium]HRY42167.1 YdaS family helix-turn-helix protein [Candidatus Krumholzibacteria bacterium]